VPTGRYPAPAGAGVVFYPDRGGAEGKVTGSQRGGVRQEDLDARPEDSPMKLTSGQRDSDH